MIRVLDSSLFTLALFTNNSSFFNQKGRLLIFEAFPQIHTLTAIIAQGKERCVAELMPGMGFPPAEWEDVE